MPYAPPLAVLTPPGKPRRAASTGACQVSTPACVLDCVTRSPARPPRLLATAPRAPRHRSVAQLLRWLGACLAAAAIVAPSAGAYELGFNDNQIQQYAGWRGKAVNDAALASALQRMRATGTQTYRIMVMWNEVTKGTTAAPTPATLAADPAWSGYRWDDVDRLMRATAAAGLRPLVWFARAPTWAEGADRPPVSALVPPGTWKPNAALLQQFATAFARRYGGSYPDPAAPGQRLPRVDLYQGWNEPNLYTEITPQYEQVGGAWTITSPARYRALQNAAYTGIKSVNPSATVLTAGTGPFGGFDRSDPRIPPALFWRELLCVTKRGTTYKANRRCPKLKFDGWAHHTYPIGPPTRTARNVDDVVVPDLAKLTKVMTAAQRAGLVKKAAAKNLWMTEMSWDSFPDPNGLSLADQALYMQGAFYVLWKAGVQHVLWWNFRDQQKGSDWNATLQSGVYLLGANPNDPSQDVAKPSLTAFRFPFTAYRLKGVAALWARPPGTGPVEVQVQRGTGWAKVTTLKARPGGVVSGRVRINPGATLRAVQGGEVSLTWRTF